MSYWYIEYMGEKISIVAILLILVIGFTIGIKISINEYKNSVNPKLIITIEGARKAQRIIDIRKKQLGWSIEAPLKQKKKKVKEFYVDRRYVRFYVPVASKKAT